MVVKDGLIYVDMFQVNNVKIKLVLILIVMSVILVMFNVKIGWLIVPIVLQVVVHTKHV